jgi:hypothetical protein
MIDCVEARRRCSIQSRARPEIALRPRPHRTSNPPNFVAFSSVKSSKNNEEACLRRQAWSCASMATWWHWCDQDQQRHGANVRCH